MLRLDRSLRWLPVLLTEALASIINSAYTKKAQRQELFFSVLSVSLFLRQLSFLEIQSSFRIGAQPSRSLKASLKMKTDVQVNFFLINGINGGEKRKILAICC